MTNTNVQNTFLPPCEGGLPSPHGGNEGGPEGRGGSVMEPEKKLISKNSLTLVQTTIAVVSFIVAVAFAIAGFIVEPTGELHDSNLYLIAQFLLVTTSIFGVSAVVSGGRWHIENHT